MLGRSPRGHFGCCEREHPTGCRRRPSLRKPLNAESMGGGAYVSLDQLSDAEAHATITLAQSTQMLNGERGKGNFNSDAKVQEQAAR
jgi:hypothetical protein